jgi:two-component system, LuxR family, sensor histidine kinase TtrS
MKKIVVLLSVILSMILCLSSASGDVKIGVLAKRGAAKCMQKWGDTGAYLSEQLGEKVVIVPLKFVAIEPALQAKKIDFLLANSAFYVEMQEKHKIEAVATLINSRKGQALQEFGGVVLVKADSPIKTVADIKGKKFMCVKYSSFGGGHMAWRLLKDNGIDPKTDCTEFLQGGKHDNVVLAVKNGAVDAGTVRTDTLERMQDEKKISITDFRIINKVDNEKFPFVCSTRLYPEWPMAACATTDPAIAKKVGEALMSLKQDAKAAQTAKVVGWSTPADYQPVKDCLVAISCGVFADGVIVASDVK